MHTIFRNILINVFVIYQDEYLQFYLQINLQFGISDIHDRASLNKIRFFVIILDFISRLDIHTNSADYVRILAYV
jgi:hypothetical protein